jgi:hypothetical protein
MAVTRQDIEFNATFNFKKSDADKLDRLLGDAFTESLQRAAKLGAHKMGEELHKKLSGTLSSTAGAIAAELEVLHTQIETLHGELEAATTDAVRVQKQNELKQKQIQVQQKERLINKERAVLDSFLDRQEEALQEYDKLRLRVSVDKKGLAKDFSDAMNEAVSKMSSGDIAGVFGDAFSLLGGAGKAIQGKGAAMAAEGASGAALVAGLGTAVTALAATAGVLAGVAAIFMLAYNQTKDLNKALLEGAGSADLFSAGVGDLAPKLGELRGAVIEVANQTRLGTDEVAKYINTLNSSGVTYKMMTQIVGENVSAQQAYVDVTMASIRASKYLGVEVSETGSFMNTMIKELGKTSLPQIEGAFAMIGDAAAKSGMATKDFFTTINESASGLALYNFRLEDTLGLMNEMVEVLGEDLAKANIGLEKRYGQMGMQDRVKTVMTSGGAAGRILKSNVGAQGSEISKNITAGLAPLMGNLAKTVTDAQGNVSYEFDAKKLGTMSEKQLRGVLGELRKSGEAGADAMARRLESLRPGAKGAQGGVLDQAAGLSSLNKAGELALELSEAQGVFGTALSEMSGTQRMAYESITGISGEAFDIRERLDRSLRTDFESMKKEGKIEKGMTFDEALSSGKLLDSDAMKEALEAGMPKMEAMSSQILTETTSVADILKNRVAQVLDWIYSLLDGFVGKFGDQKTKAISSSIARQAERSSKVVELTDEKRKLEEKKRLGSATPEDEARTKELKHLIEATREAAAGEKTFREGLGKRSFEEEVKKEKVFDSSQINPVAKLAANWISPGTLPMLDWMAKGTAQTEVIARQTSSIPVPEELARERATAEAAADAEALKEKEVQDKKVNKDATSLLKATEGVSDTVEESFSDYLKKQQDWEQSQARSTLSSVYGSDLLADAMSGKTAGLNSAIDWSNPALIEAAARAGLDLKRTPGAEDFIYRGNGTSGSITPINTMDRAIAMAKPGGPLERVAGGGGGGNVTIIIQGGDLNKVREVVMNTVKLGMNARGV